MDTKVEFTQEAEVDECRSRQKGTNEVRRT